jgi:hypothetical protein
MLELLNCLFVYMLIIYILSLEGINLYFPHVQVLISVFAPQFVHAVYVSRLLKG